MQPSCIKICSPSHSLFPIPCSLFTFLFSLFPFHFSLFTFLFSLFTFHLSAQPQSKPELSLKAGYHYFWFSEPEYDPHFMASYNYPNNGWFIAADVNLPYTDLFSMNFELQYLHKEFMVESAWGGLGGGSFANYHYQLGNIYAKAEPRFNFGKKRLRFFCYPGLYAGVLAHSSISGTLHHWQMGYPGYSSTDTITGSARGYFPGFEFGFIAGLGADYAVSERIRIAFNYDFRINLFTVSDAWGSDRVKMFGMDFGLGVVYRLGKK